ncbi:hypothetical protein bAD24_III10515 [Burkholderia sp. AD24]|nr:hypothetical protein bAD24_III10515 [Burkholderia sp. AD24]
MKDQVVGHTTSRKILASNLQFSDGIFVFGLLRAFAVKSEDAHLISTLINSEKVNGHHGRNVRARVVRVPNAQSLCNL